MEVYRAGREIWGSFRRYHYLSHELHRSAECYVGVIEDALAVFCAITNFPHARVPNFKAVHRLVVLPDYQGVGLGAGLLDHVAAIYKQARKRVIITTGNPAMKKALEKDEHWEMTRMGRVKPHGRSSHTGMKEKSSNKRVTASWEYR